MSHASSSSFASFASTMPSFVAPRRRCRRPRRRRPRAPSDENPSDEREGFPLLLNTHAGPAPGAKSRGVPLPDASTATTRARERFTADIAGTTVTRVHGVADAAVTPVGDHTAADKTTSTEPSAVATAARAIPRRGSTSTRVGALPCPARATCTVLRRSSSPAFFASLLFPSRFPPPIRGSVGIIVCRPGATTTKPFDEREFEFEFAAETKWEETETTSAPAGRPPRVTPRVTLMRSKPLIATGKGHPLATTSGARTSTRIGAGPDRAPCVAHAGSHVTASRMGLASCCLSDKDSFLSDKESEETRSSCTVGDLSVVDRVRRLGSLTGTVPRHLAKAKGTRVCAPPRACAPSSPPDGGSRGSRRSRSGDVGSTPRTGSLTPALTTPRAATVSPSGRDSITSYSQSHGKAVCMDRGGCATSRHAHAGAASPPPSASFSAVTPASGSATTTTNTFLSSIADEVSAVASPSSEPFGFSSFGSARASDASHGPCALKPHSLFFRPREPARTGHRWEFGRPVPQVEDEDESVT
mmetsp:Transcript_13256/g.53498  ORF Transcript_13256/g.53498 Transcript_13256/m.53498 type:complete len:528 (+) Transcript_13256:940-2523(+)